MLNGAWDIVYLRNGWGSAPDFGGYLDTRSSGCQGNKLCVSTSTTANSGTNTSKWTVEGGRYFVYTGQGLGLKNNYSDAAFRNTYLDTRGRGCQNNLLCVSTSDSPNRDSGSGTWRFSLTDRTSYAERFAPRLKFDNAVNGFPMSAQVLYNHVIINGNAGLEIRDPGTLGSGTIPTYYQIIKADNQLRIKYWWFYGYQQTCDGISGNHNGDWEDVTVILSEDRNSVAAITFTMHGYPYTRLAARGGFGIEEQTHPIVHVAKNSHASHFESGGTSVSCLPWDEFHNTSNGVHMDSWKKLVNLDMENEAWISRDRLGGFSWGPNGVNTHPTTQGPTANMMSMESSLTIDTGRHTQCKYGDGDWNLWCMHGASWYELKYEIPRSDAGLLRSY